MQTAISRKTATAAPFLAGPSDSHIRPSQERTRSSHLRDCPGQFQHCDDWLRTNPYSEVIKIYSKHRWQSQRIGRCYLMMLESTVHNAQTVIREQRLPYSGIKVMQIREMHDHLFALHQPQAEPKVVTTESLPYLDAMSQKVPASREQFSRRSTCTIQSTARRHCPSYLRI